MLFAALLIIHTGVSLCLVTVRICGTVLVLTSRFTCLRSLPVTTLPVDNASLLMGNRVTLTSLL